VAGRDCDVPGRACGGSRQREETVTERPRFLASPTTSPATPGAYTMDWTSPDGTGHWHGDNAVYIQLHQTCGWVPKGYLTGTHAPVRHGHRLPFCGRDLVELQPGVVGNRGLNAESAVPIHVQLREVGAGTASWRRLHPNGTYSPNGTAELTK
jgi:hypothetical protein